MKKIVPSQREAVICRGARAQVFKTEVNENLRNAPFLFTLRPLVIGIFHAKQISGGSQAIKVKVYSPSTNNHTPRLAEATGTVHANINLGGISFNFFQFFIVPCYYIIHLGCFICIYMLFYIVFGTNLLT